jgi:transposase InsO family protein
MIGLDLVGPLTISHGFRYVLNLIDYLSGWTESIPLVSTTGADIRDAVRRHWILRFGAPTIIVTDNGANLSRGAFKEYCQELGTTLVATSPYHPQTNGMVERYNGFMSQQIRRRLAHQSLPESEWSDHVQSTVWTWNTQIKAIRGRSPFEILFGQLPRQPLHNVLDPIPYATDLPVDVDEHHVNMLRDLRDIVHACITADHEFDERHNPRPEPRRYHIGDRVLVHRSALDKQWSGKFQIRWAGPFVVSKIRVGGAYVLATVPSRASRASRSEIQALPAFGGRPINHLRLKPYRERSTAGAFVRALDLEVLIRPEQSIEVDPSAIYFFNCYNFH